MGHHKTTTGRAARALLGALAIAALFLLALASPVLADPPSHSPAPSLDLEGLDKACGAATDNKGDLYASSPGEDKVKVYDPSHVLLTSISNANDPCGLAVSTKGELLVSEQGTGNVVMYVPDAYPLTATPTYSPAVTIDAASGEARGISVDRTDDRLYVAEGTHVAIYNRSEVQGLSRTGSGGSFKLKFKGEETAPFALGASAAEIQTALEALSTIGTGNVAVSGNSISFLRELAYTDVPQVEAVSSLTGNETQKLTVKASAGTYKLKFEDEETAPIAFNAAAAAVQAALEGLMTIAPGDVAVAGGPGDAGGTSPYEVTFGGAYADANVNELSADASGLSGGTASAQTTTQGAGTTVSTTTSGGLDTDDEVQGISIASATGGTFKLKFEGPETTPIPYNASAAEVKAALEALSTIGAGNVAVAGTYQVTFTGTLAHTDVETLGTDFSGLVGAGAKVTVTESTKGFNGHVGTGDLTNATGVAAYTYIYTGISPSNLKRHSYLTVADAATDELKVFSAREGTSLKLRRTIAGVDHDENPQTAEQAFGFGPEGAYLVADPGNESRETRKCIQVQIEAQNQACTQGHFFVYDDANEAVDEFDATGEFVDQITNGGFADAEPTALAVERSGTASDGTLYVGAGASTGAKLLAFRPLGMPERKHLTALSRALTGARAVATDCEGYVYVAVEASVRVYGPAGNEVTSFEDAEAPIDLAADCEGNVYAVDGSNGAERMLAYYSPSSYPPTGSTTYTREPELIPGEFEGDSLQAVAINPADEHAFVLGGTNFTPVMVEYGSAGEESPVIGECGAGLGLVGTRFDIDVYGATGEVYVTGSSQNLAKVSCAEPEELLNVQIKGGGCPNGEIGQNPRVAIDQSNGHIIEFANNQAGGVREFDSSGACVAEFGTFSTSASYRVAVDSSCAVHDPPLSEQTTPKCAATYPSNGNVYVASDGANNTVQPYDVNAFGPLEYPIPPGEPPAVETGGADGFGPGEATLRGSVNPNSSTLEECTFEYLTEAEYQGNGEAFAGAEALPCAESPAEIGNGGNPVPVHVDLEGLGADTPYRYRLTATNEFGTDSGDPESFTLEPPEVVAKSALPVSYDEATLRGEVDPAGSPSTYHFEYLTEAEHQENEENEVETFSGAQSTPVAELPAGEGLVAVKAAVTGLEEGTPYRFRLVAENGVGEASEEGPPFETLVRPPLQDCANAEYRTGLGAFLPDCRAYELVTPAEMLSTPGGLTRLGSFSSGSGHRFFNSWFVAPRGASAGESLAYRAMVPGADSHPFRAQRGEGEHPKTGWQNEPFGLSFAQGGGGDGEPGGVSADQRYALYEVLGHETPTEQTFPVGTYLHVQAGEASRECAPEPKAQFEAADPESKFELVGCGDLGTDPQAEGRFVSADGTHVIFSSKEHLDDDAAPQGTEAIYDREAGKAETEVVSVKPDGTPFGGGEAPRYLATTEDGSAVVFSTGGVGGPLYVSREDETTHEWKTTQVAEGPNTYAGISEDGKRVFFMGEGFFPIEEIASPSPASLFACDVEAGPCTSGAKPGLKEIATESNFVNVSADGSHVFFTSEQTEPSEVMELDENENGEEAEEGEANLYAWDGVQASFVAILDPQDLVNFRTGESLEEEQQLEDLLEWTSAIPGQLATSGGSYEAGRAYSPTRSTPDGSVFAFQSHAQLTDYDNGGRGEIYRYAPAAPVGSQLACVSCDPSGAPHDSIADAIFQSLFQGVTNSSTMIPNLSDDGQRVLFESREPLLPEDANEVTDVYQWKAAGTEGPGGDTCQRPQGCLALISTGQGEAPSLLYGASADGEDAFFVTQEKLVGADALGTFSIYDARVLGGIPDPPLKAPCQGDACQGQGSAPPALPPLASTGQGKGNEQAKPSRCAKGKHRVKGRCVKKQSKKHKQHKQRKHSNQQRANHERGASR